MPDSVSVDLLVSTRAHTKLTRAASAALVYVPASTWAGWEKGVSCMPGAIFKLYLIKTGLQSIKPKNPGLDKISYTAQQPTADRIKARRKQAGISQAEAAELVFATEKTWRNWEQDKSKMRRGVFELFLLRCGYTLLEATKEEKHAEWYARGEALYNAQQKAKQEKAKQTKAAQQTSKPYQPDPETQRQALEAWADDDEPDILAKFGMSTAALIAEVQAESEARTQQAKPAARLIIDLDKELGTFG